jgi:maleylacetoacetate isomerase
VKLYTFFRSSASYRVRIALALKGLAYEAHFISLPKSEHSTDAFRAVNPQALVPALADDDQVLVQSLAIMEYLEEIHPQPPLLPAAAADRAYVRAVAQLVACDIHPLNNLRTLKYIRKTYGLDEEGVNAWYRHWIAEGFDMMESFLGKERRSGRFCLGEQPTMADCCLVPQVFNAQRYKCDLSHYPTVMRINDECAKLDAFVKAHPMNQPDAPARS